MLHALDALFVWACVVAFIIIIITPKFEVVQTFKYHCPVHHNLICPYLTYDFMIEISQFWKGMTADVQALK